MDPREPSRTALAAAAHRAAHQVLEQGAIFADPLALAILGPDAESAVRDAEAEPSRRGMRLFIAARSAIAEAALAEGVGARGVRQVVVLGAGLDTFAYRNPHAEAPRVFEVDHPATQAWKRRRLAEAKIAEPDGLVFAAFDFEQDNLLARLAASGFDPSRRSFFLWLGVVPYLTEAAVFATLGQIGGLSGGAEVAFDYADPPETLSPEMRAAHEARAQRVAAAGEPFLSYFEPASLHAELRARGFETIADLGPQALAARFFPGAAARLPDRGGHVLIGRTAVVGA